MCRTIISILYFYVLIYLVSSANILYISPVASPSHHIVNRALAYGLVEKGHNVTLIGPDDDKLTRPQNYTSILLEGLYDGLNSSFDLNEMVKVSTMKMVAVFRDWSLFHCRRNLKSQGFQTLMNYPEDFKFDLIVFDISIGYCLYPLITRFNNPPVVGISAFLLPPYISYNYGNVLVPAYLPWYGLPHTSDMSFAERLMNTVFTYLDVIQHNYFEYSKVQEIVYDCMGHDLPKWTEIERNISLLLTNSNPVLDYPYPLPPNIITVGGLHIKPARKINDDWQEILDKSKHGVIVFSLGSNIKSDKLSPVIQQTFIKVFSRLNQTVIWKFESAIDNLPKNVIVQKWLPQSDILGHPNVRLFIGHGGAMSTQESIFHGVPMLCIPFIVDQFMSARMLTARKIGIGLDFEKITVDYLTKNLFEVLNNPIYRENAKKASSRLRDSPQTPLESAVFWTEYVLRHGGAEFLNPKARDLPFYQSSGADVLIFLLLIIIITISFIIKLLGFALKIFLTNKKKVKTN